MRINQGNLSRAGTGKAAFEVLPDCPVGASGKPRARRIALAKIHTGGCQCGAVRYEAAADPIMIYACHCTICQRQSGSAFGMAVVFDGRALTMTGIDPAHFIRQGHGRKFRCYFCPECGTRIYHQWFSDSGDFPFLSIKPGTLDDTSWIAPGCHVWAQHAQPWIRFSDADVVFAQQPGLEEMPRFERR
jgi:hypothetical protein